MGGRMRNFRIEMMNGNVYTTVGAIQWISDDEFILAGVEFRLDEVREMRMWIS